MTTKLEKGIITADSTCRAVADIDGSESQVKLKAINLTLKQEVNFDVEGQKYNMVSIIGK